MRLIVGAAERGILGPQLVIGIAFSLLMFAAVHPGPAVQVAPYVALMLAASLIHRRLFGWRSLLIALVAVVLFIPIRRYTMPGNLPFELEPYRVLVALVGVGWIVSMLVDPRVRLRKSGFEAPLLAFVFAALGSILFNVSRINALGVQAEVLKKLTFFASFFIVLYLIVSVARTHELVDTVVKWLVGGGAIVAIAATYESWTGYNVFSDLGRVIPVLELTYAPELNVRGSRLRVFGSSQHPIALGVAFVMLLPLAIYLYRRFARRRWLLAGAAITLGAFSTVSRTTILMLLVVGIVFFRLRPVETKKLWPVILPALVVVHFALPGALGTLHESFFPEGGLIAEQTQGAGGRGSGRVADIGPSLEQWKRQPLLGQGFGTRIVDEGPLLNAFILDNQWLATLLETGLAGILSWIWLFRSFIGRVCAAAKADPSPRGWLLTAIAASVSAYALGMLTYDAWSFIQVTFLLFILLGLGCVALQQRERAPAAGVVAERPARRPAREPARPEPASASADEAQPESRDQLSGSEPLSSEPRRKGGGLRAASPAEVALTLGALALALPALVGRRGRAK